MLDIPKLDCVVSGGTGEDIGCSRVEENVPDLSTAC